MRVLVAEDERDLNEIICKKLRSEDYCVDSCLDGEEALDYLSSVTYDAVILDIMMPKRTGLQVVEQLRRQGDQTPVLFLTARDSVDDRVIGLDAGADDYLVKPFAFEELLARLRVMTRKRSGERSNVYAIDDLTLDIRSKTVQRGGVVLNLSAKEYALLEYLIRNKGVVLSRAQIEENIWGFDYEGSSNIVDVYIRYLRRKVDKDHPVKLIHTIRGSGYTLRLP